MARRVVLAVVLLAITASVAVAQITSATISGTIKDETGGVLPGVDVVIRNVETGLTRSVVTDSNGYFTVPGLPPGRYEARASLQGFRTGVQTGIALAVAQQAGLNLVLKVGTTEEPITVRGESALVETRSSALSAIVPEKTIEELPLNGRNYIMLATLQPGVVQFTEKLTTSPAQRGVSLNINGMGGRSNSFLIDGANMRGYAGMATVTASDSTLGVETIQEFRVVTNAFSADYGRAMGGVVSIATKSGTNRLQGSGFEFFRNSKMDARNFVDVGEPPPFTRHQYGGAVGGPVVRNKIFFFGGVERLQEDLGTTVITAVPTAAARAGLVNPVVRPYLDLYPAPNGRDLGPGIGQYTYEFTRVTRENFLQGRIDVALSDRDLLFVRHTYDGSRRLSPVSSGVIQTTGLRQFLTNSPSGKHLFKTGALVEHAFAQKLTTVKSRGTYTFANVAQFLAGIPSRFQGNAPGSNFERKRPNTLFGFYVQDDYRVTSNLTLNLGARYEFFTVPKDKDGLDAYLPDILTSPTTSLGGPFVNPSLKNIAPRVGFAWDISGDGRTAVRGGSGLYYDTDGPYNSSLGISIQTPPFVLPVNVTGAGIPFPTPVFPSGTTGGALSMRTIDYHIKQPKGWTYNINVQRELAGSWAAMVGYAGSRGYDLVNAIEGNPVVPVVRADGSLFFPAGAPRRNPAWSSIDYRMSDGRSTPNALQPSLMKRFSDGYQVQLSYTLSKAMDNADGQLGTDTVTSSVYPQNPYDLDAEWAVASFDARHVFSANATWELPPFRNQP